MTGKDPRASIPAVDTLTSTHSAGCTNGQFEAKCGESDLKGCVSGDETFAGECLVCLILKFLIGPGCR